jgi:hypothetical protein
MKLRIPYSNSRLNYNNSHPIVAIIKHHNSSSSFTDPLSLVHLTIVAPPRSFPHLHYIFSLSPLILSIIRTSPTLTMPYY